MMRDVPPNDTSAPNTPVHIIGMSAATVRPQAQINMMLLSIEVSKEYNHNHIEYKSQCVLCLSPAAEVTPSLLV